MNRIHSKVRQSGIAVIEFTIVATVLLLVLFTIMDAGRYMYTSQILNDMTRQAARLATVCQVGDPDIATNASVTANAPSSYQSTSMVIEYLDKDGVKLTSPETKYDEIAFVRATVKDVGYQSFSLLPLFTSSDAFPDYVTEIPAENLGVLRETKNRTGDKKTDC
ncbi:TadE/TadG family type IV pilus assembly protein [Vibrio sp. SCSIO 43137]|uniref:TadE/TadG family type IV pilus assembly protein n=1 Tax=Vibrio sp. SCSIO 43137 TaxID=3021011 RepID=UPI00230775A1|nr:TadE/TadG family type IV pilus assembly protein [Vibrio sp. SCSIO 43137]WCE29116.1 TadE/TadG family type IV pilus assembly protein [Vibrio sp. SCSIO 43137]